MVDRRRRLRRALVGLAAVALMGGALVAALPEIVRRVALRRLPALTGRAAAIGDVDLNFFTGRLAIRQFRLADRESPEPLVAFERLDLRLRPLALLRSHVRIVELTLVAPSVRIVRTGPATFNFSDLLDGPGARAPASPAPAPPGRWTFTVERARVSGGRARVDDRAVSPAAAWELQGLDVDASGLTTRAGAPPGRLAAGARINEARLAVAADRLGIDPPVCTGTVALDGVELGWLDPYVWIPRGVPHRPRGRLSATLAIEVDSERDALTRARVSGTAELTGATYREAGRRRPFLSIARLGVAIKEADAIARTLTVASATIDGLDLTVRRRPPGVIDLLEMFAPGRPAGPPPGSGPSSPAASPRPPRGRTLFPVIQGLAEGLAQIRLERVTLEPATARFVDEAVRPVTTLALTRLRARLDEFTWPVRGPARLTLSTGLPGGGSLEARGPVTVHPLDADITMRIRDSRVEPFQVYIPVPARLSGRFSGDSRNRIVVRDGRLVARSTGTSWATGVAIGEPGAARPAIRVERMELAGVDFEWPTRARAARATFLRPRLEVERGADGDINLRRLFTAREATRGAQRPAPPAPAPARLPPASTPAAARSPLETLDLHVGEIRIEEGFVRFLDRTTRPAASQDLSRLAVTVTGFGNRRDRRARLLVQSLVGGDGGLDVRGEISAIGAPLSVDLVGELRRFSLPSVDPYAAAAVGWVIKQGELGYTLRFTLDGDRLDARNDVTIGRLQVAPAGESDEATRRLGLPLGLIVALVKDQAGDIRVSVPVTGSLRDPAFDLREAIWTTVRNVLVNIVAAPFKAIGRLLSGGGAGDKLEVPRIDPVTFASGSAVLTPSMEEHLLRVADVLRRSPFVNLTLRAVPGAGDVEALRREAVGTRLRAFQAERGLDDAAAAVAAYYRARLPDVPVPATLEEQVALLEAREPVPVAPLAALGRRRLEAARDRLVAAEGIPPGRLAVEEPPAAEAPVAAPAGGEGRVELAVVAGG